MKKTLLLALVLSVLPLNALAGLVEDVDKLSPDEAYLVVNKLQAKTLQPVPESFFTRLAVSVSGRVAFTQPKDFNASVNAVHNFKELPNGEASLLWRLTDHFLLGFNAGVIGQESEKEVSATVFDNVGLMGGYFHVAAGYKIELSDRWLLLPVAGLGPFATFVVHEYTDDATKATWTQRYTGNGFSAAGTVSLLYKLNPIWTIGLDNAFFYGKVNNQKRINEANNTKIDLTGYQLGVRVGFNF